MGLDHFRRRRRDIRPVKVSGIKPFVAGSRTTLVGWPGLPNIGPDAIRAVAHAGLSVGRQLLRSCGSTRSSQLKSPLSQIHADQAAHTRRYLLRLL